MFEFNVFNNKIPAKNIPFVEWPTINFSERPLLLNGSLHSCFMKIVFLFQSSCKILQAQLISNQKILFICAKVHTKLKWVSWTWVSQKPNWFILTCIKSFFISRNRWATRSQLPYCSDSGLPQHGWSIVTRWNACGYKWWVLSDSSTSCGNVQPN